MVSLCNGKPPDGVTAMIGVEENAGGMWIGGGMAPALAELFDSDGAEEPELACAAARDDCEASERSLFGGREYSCDECDIGGRGKRSEMLRKFERSVVAGG